MTPMENKSTDTERFESKDAKVNVYSVKEGSNSPGPLLTYQASTDRLSSWIPNVLPRYLVRDTYTSCETKKYGHSTSTSTLDHSLSTYLL